MNIPQLYFLNFAISFIIKISNVKLIYATIITTTNIAYYNGLSLFHIHNGYENKEEHSEQLETHGICMLPPSQKLERRLEETELMTGNHESNIYNSNNDENINNPDIDTGANGEETVDKMNDDNDIARTLYKTDSESASAKEENINYDKEKKIRGEEKKTKRKKKRKKDMEELEELKISSSKDNEDISTTVYENNKTDFVAGTVETSEKFADDIFEEPEGSGSGSGSESASESESESGGEHMFTDVENESNDDSNINKNLTEDDKDDSVKESNSKEEFEKNREEHFDQEEVEFQKETTIDINKLELEHLQNEMKEETTSSNSSEQVDSSQFFPAKKKVAEEAANRTEEMKNVDKKKEAPNKRIEFEMNTNARMLQKPEFLKNMFNRIFDICLIIKLGAIYRYENFLIPLKDTIITKFLNKLDILFITLISVHKTSCENYRDGYAFILLILLLCVSKVLLKKLFFRKGKIQNDGLKNKQNENNVYIENLLKRILFHLEKNKNIERYENTLNEILENTENIIVNINIINKENKHIYTDIISNINNIGVYTYISTQALKKLNSKSDMIINELISSRLLINDENDSKNLSELNDLSDLKKNLLNEYTDMPDMGNNNISGVGNINSLKNYLLNAFDDKEPNNLKNNLLSEYVGETINPLKGNLKNDMNNTSSIDRKQPDFVNMKMMVADYVNDSGMNRKFEAHNFGNARGLMGNIPNIPNDVSGIASANIAADNTVPINDESMLSNNKNNMFLSRKHIDEMNQNILSTQNLSPNNSLKDTVLDKSNASIDVQPVSPYADNAHYTKRLSNQGNVNTMSSISNSAMINSNFHTKGNKELGSVVNVNSLAESEDKRNHPSESTAQINNTNIKNFPDERSFDENELKFSGNRDLPNQVTNATSNDSILKKKKKNFFFDESNEIDEEKELMKGGISNPMFPPLNANANFASNINTVSDMNNFTPGHMMGLIPATANIDNIHNFEKDKRIEPGIENIAEKESMQNKNVLGRVRNRYNTTEKDHDENIKNYAQTNITYLENEDNFEKRNENDVSIGPPTMNSFINKNEEIPSEEMMTAMNSMKPGISYVDSLKSQSKSKDHYTNTSSTSPQILEGNFNRNNKYVTQRKERQKIVATKSPFS